MNSPKRSFVAEWGFPLLVGVLIEISSDLLKLVSHYSSTSVYAEVSSGIFAELRSFDFWVGIAFTIGLVAVLLWVLENWPRAHPKLWVRITLVIFSVIIVGVIDPPSHAFKDRILAAYDQARLGESMDDVLDQFQFHGDILIEPNKDKKPHNESDCVDSCWLRVRYQVPVIFGERWVTLEFAQDQKLIRKCDIDWNCTPTRSLIH
jgi:hypothetical protein